MADVLVKEADFKAIVEAIQWIDKKYEDVNLDHRHFRVGAKCKASDALELLFASQPSVTASEVKP